MLALPLNPLSVDAAHLSEVLFVAHPHVRHGLNVSYRKR